MSYLVFLVSIKSVFSSDASHLLFLLTPSPSLPPPTLPLHRVWDFVLSGVFGMDCDRALPRDRLASLSTHQEAFLTAFSGLLATQLCVGAGAGANAGTDAGNTQVVASLEKRSVALRLTVEMVRLNTPLA